MYQPGHPLHQGPLHTGRSRAFRRHEPEHISLLKIRQALEVLTRQGELRNALASQQLYTDGAEILYDYADDHEEPLLRLLPS